MPYDQGCLMYINNDLKRKDELRKILDCPLCHKLCSQAMTITDCMHTFCKSCILNYVKKNHKCPECKLKIDAATISNIKPDYQIQSLIKKIDSSVVQDYDKIESNDKQDLDQDVEKYQRRTFSRHIFVKFMPLKRIKLYYENETKFENFEDLKWLVSNEVYKGEQELIIKYDICI
ncbi:hypothetical protein ROZALSC1DRAFT_31028 [Rozella allomycis CSF55]|uniref:Zinc finger, RING-type domain-containing protein n=1 Tax=Rozella allomycis (strain CSF55) TaxID=988480 RepID=A0A075APT0_ROZAC|nr:Zinc finger, RING-type domain-containing protein [Rozella allomycis CSF55]RKP17138.1 hypothetical protein ROZALSC1DRAFT_31028 [Rozella allomycis CSF55]|eukprot:EPZ32088.1 Zinc finger, RING-type domain-containing protein [Rozella allomycis CSF55]